MLKQVPEQDVGSATLYFQLGQDSSSSLAPAREGEKATTAKTLEHATMGQPFHPTFLVAGTDVEERSFGAFRYKVSPALETRNKASHMMF